MCRHMASLGYNELININALKPEMMIYECLYNFEQTGIVIFAQLLQYLICETFTNALENINVDYLFMRRGWNECKRVLAI